MHYAHSARSALSSADFPTARFRAFNQTRWPSSVAAKTSSERSSGPKLSLSTHATLAIGSINLIMEQQPSTCDMYSEPEVCCQFTGPLGEYAIERHVRRFSSPFWQVAALSGLAVLSILVRTLWEWHGLRFFLTPTIDRIVFESRSYSKQWLVFCHNMALGAHVISVEPRSDFAKPFKILLH